MKPLRLPQLALPLLFVLACGTSDTTALPPSAMAPASSFERTDLGLELREPVLARDARGAVHAAAIDHQRGWPVFLVEGRAPVSFPGAGGVAEELALVAGPDGFLHAAWTVIPEAQRTRPRRLAYARIAPETLEGEMVLLTSDISENPSLAVSPDGTVFITYAEGWISREPTYRLALLRGSLEDGFGDAEYPDAACCATYREGRAWSVSRAAIAFTTSGEAHLAYAHDGLLAYLRQTARGWARLAGGAEVDHRAQPSLAVELDRSSIVYVDRDRTRVFGARYMRGILGEPTLLHGGPKVFAAVMAYAGGDVAHLGVEVQLEDGYALDYVYWSHRTSFARRITTSEQPGETLQLTDGPGGAILSGAGELLLPHRRGGERWGGAGRAEVVVGRPAE